MSNVSMVLIMLPILDNLVINIKNNLNKESNEVEVVSKENLISLSEEIVSKNEISPHSIEINLIFINFIIFQIIQVFKI